MQHTANSHSYLFQLTLSRSKNFVLSTSVSYKCWSTKPNMLNILWPIFQEPVITQETRLSISFQQNDLNTGYGSPDWTITVICHRSSSGDNSSNSKVLLHNDILITQYSQIILSAFCCRTIMFIGDTMATTLLYTFLLFYLG